MEAEFAAWEAALPVEHEIARPVDPPRGHSRPGNEVSVTWEIASTPPPAEALATALSYEEEEEEQVAARHQQRHRQLLQESLALDCTADPSSIYVLCL